MYFNPEPTLLSVMVTDFIVLLLILSASWTAFRVLLRWEPESVDREQLGLEIAFETSSIKVRAAALAFLFSTLVMIVAIANVFPKIVPGAMCGTGVIQATDGMGNRALIFRFAAVSLLFFVCEMERLDRTVPDSILVQTTARFLLVALPVVLLSMISTIKAISALNIQQSVDCCAALYDTVRSSRDISITETIPDTWWVVAFTTGAAFLVVLGLRIRRASGARSIHELSLTALISFAWAVIAWITLLKILSAYHYQVLNHHCPWCLFLPEHHLVGYPLLAALVLTAFEGTMALTAAHMGNKHPELRAGSQARIRKAGLRIVCAVILFLLISGLPAVLWRLKYGVWITG